jgi:hypothetical protein
VDVGPPGLAGEDDRVVGSAVAGEAVGAELRAAERRGRLGDDGRLLSVGEVVRVPGVTGMVATAGGGGVVDGTGDQQ